MERVLLLAGNARSPFNFGEAGAEIVNEGFAPIYHASTENGTVDGNIAVGTSKLLFGTQYLWGTLTTSLRVLRNSLASPNSVVGRVAVLEEHTPMGSVVYAQKHLNKVGTVYANTRLALQGAMDETPSYGGTVILPSNLLTIGDAQPLQFPAKPIEFWGAQRNATILYFPNDTGINTFAIKRPDGVRSTIRRMTIQGPVSALTNGPAPALMHGVIHLSGHGLEDLHIQGFRGGIARTGNHNWMRDVASKANMYGLYLIGMWATESAPTSGNSDISSPMQLDANVRGGIGVAPDGGAFGERWSGIHFGMGPTAVYFEVDGSNNAGTIAGIVLDTAAFENMGNGLFYSESTNPVGAGLLLMTITNSMFSQYPGATNLAPLGMRSSSLRNNRAHIDGLSAVNLTMTDCDIMSMGAADTPLLMQHSGYCALDIRGRYARQTLEAMITTGGRIYSNPNNFITQRVTFEENYDRAEMHYCDAVGISAGRLVAKSSEGAVIPWVAGEEVFGVALQNGIAYEFIPIGRFGKWPVANSLGGALAVGQAVMPAAGGVVQAAAAAPSQAIGVAQAAIAAGATGMVEFMPAGYRY